MSSILFSLPELYISYKKWVSSHPQLASDFETTTKWVSYFIAGRINNSTIVSELVYSLSNLLVLFNDRIICKAQKLEVPGSGDTLKLWLTVLDYSEVFFELSAKKLWGEAGKWVVIVVLQMFKCISRLLLLFQHKQNIIENPPIPVLKRGKLGQTNYSTDYSVDEARNQLESMSFVLKRSGKVIRKVEAAPPVSVRNWKPLSVENNNYDRVQGAENTLIGRQLVAETLYVLKPMAHLGSVLCFGNNTWKPWMISLFIDLVSLRLHQTCQNSKVTALSKQRQLQISRRHLALLLYLLRSPFYERHSKDRVRSFLLGLGRNIPLVGLISTPLAKYIPHWQRTYFYMWST